MGRQPRSGDIPWLSAHSTLNWIGGDKFMLDPFAQKSRVLSRLLASARHCPKIAFPNRELAHSRRNRMRWPSLIRGFASFFRVSSVRVTVTCRVLKFVTTGFAAGGRDALPDSRRDGGATKAPATALRPKRRSREALSWRIPKSRDGVATCRRYDVACQRKAKPKPWERDNIPYCLQL
jgi:hypothetical protein